MDCISSHNNPHGKTYQQKIMALQLLYCQDKVVTVQ